MQLTYAVVFERAPSNWAAYVPDVPGCVGVGDTWEETRQLIEEALAGHIELMLEDGDPVPEPTISIDDVIRSHLEFVSEDLGDLLPDLDEPSPTVAVRFEPVEIEIRVPQAVRGIPESAYTS